MPLFLWVAQSFWPCAVVSAAAMPGIPGGVYGESDLVACIDLVAWLALNQQMAVLVGGEFTSSAASCGQQSPGGGHPGPHCH